MYTLLSGLWRYLTQKNEYCILILGIDNAGKTTFLEHVKKKYATKAYRGIPFDRITPTVGMNVGQVDLKSDRLILWDLGGQEELRTLWDKYFIDCHGVIYMVDATDVQRLEESYESFNEVIGTKDLEGIPLLVMANKQDKEDALKADGIKEIFNRSASKIGKRDCMLLEMSAISGFGIEEGVTWMLQCVKRNHRRLPREKLIT